MFVQSIKQLKFVNYAWYTDEQEHGSATVGFAVYIANLFFLTSDTQASIITIKNAADDVLGK